MVMCGETGLFAHLPAASRASPADLGAFRHFGVAHGLAGFGAGFADGGAGGAGQRVQLRVARHEIGAGLAHLNAVHHQPHMARLDMMAALLDAIGEQCRLAGVAARPALLDAMMQRGVGVVMHGGLQGLEA